MLVGSIWQGMQSGVSKVLRLHWTKRSWQFLTVTYRALLAATGKQVLTETLNIRFKTRQLTSRSLKIPFRNVFWTSLVSGILSAVDITRIKMRWRNPCYWNIVPQKYHIRIEARNNAMLLEAQTMCSPQCFTYRKTESTASGKRKNLSELFLGSSVRNPAGQKEVITQVANRRKRGINSARKYFVNDYGQRSKEVGCFYG